MTHPIPRSHHGLLFTAQFVEDVVGQLDAARPQLPCREQDTGRQEGGGTGCESLFLEFYFEDARSIRQRSSQKSSPESPSVFTKDYILH